MRKERYARQLSLAEIGEEGQRKLSEARVLVIGAGGLGSAALAYLAGAGVGTIGVCDADTVSESNLQRQVLYSTPQVGLPKVLCAKRRLEALNPGIRVFGIRDLFIPETARRLVAGCDLVLDCTDNFQARFAIDDACFAEGKPWIHGAIGEFNGRVALLNGKAAKRYGDICPDREEVCSARPNTTGVLGAVAGVVGAIQAAQAVKHIVGFGDTLDGRLFTIDLLTMESSIFTL